MVRKNLTLSLVISLLVILLGAICLPSAAQSDASNSNESLGDAARRIRAEKNKSAVEAPQPLPAGGQQPGLRQNFAAVWQELSARGEEAMNGWDYVTAEKIFREALAYAEQHSLGTMMVAESTDEVGWSLRLQRNYAAAEGFHRSALQMRRSLYPENHPSIAESKVGLGMALVGLGRYSEAEGLLLEALAAYHQQPQTTLCVLSFPLDGLTMLYKSNHQYSKGERIYTEAFALMTANQGTPCENFVSMLDHLAELFADDNQWERVEKIQRSRASLALGMEGAHNELYGDALAALATTLQKRRRFEEAAAAYAQAADVFRHTDPPALSKLAQSLDYQEVNLQLAGKGEEAKQVHPAVLAAVQESNAVDPRGDMLSIRASAVEARQEGNIEEAAQLTAQEVAASHKLSTSDQIIALSDSAMIHQEQQKFTEAEADLRRILELSIASTGAASHATAEAYVGLGRFYSRSRRLGEAEESYAAALALLNARDTDELKTVLAALGPIYMTDGKSDRAEAAYQRSVKLAEETHDDAGLSHTLQLLAILYQNTGRLSEAEAAITRAMNLASQLPKPLNGQWAAAAMTAADLYEKSGRPRMAEQLYGRIVTFLEQEYGSNLPGLRLPLDKLIALLKSQGRLSEAATYEARRDKLPPMPAMPGMAQ